MTQLVYAFDTLAYAKKLETAGLSQRVAEAQAEAQAEIIAALTARFATKSDLKELEYKLTVRLGGIMISGVAVLATLMTLLTLHHPI